MSLKEGRSCELIQGKLSFGHLETRGGLEPKCVAQLIMGSLLGTRRSAIGQYFPALVTFREVFGEVNFSQFHSRMVTGVCLFQRRQLIVKARKRVFKQTCHFEAVKLLVKPIACNPVTTIDRRRRKRDWKNTPNKTRSREDVWFVLLLPLPFELRTNAGVGGRREVIRRQQIPDECVSIPQWYHSLASRFVDCLYKQTRLCHSTR